MKYWPGTKIPKSQNNAFTDWKSGKESLANNRSWRQSLIGQKNAAHSKKNSITFKRSS